MRHQQPGSATQVPIIDPTVELPRDTGGLDDTAEPAGQFPPSPSTPESEHEGGTEEEVGDRTGPGAGYDQEPEQEPDQGGVA
jgi:hypothetical protein